VFSSKQRISNVGTRAAVSAPKLPNCSARLFLLNPGAKSSDAGVICSGAAAPDSAREVFFSIGGAAELRR
jgi:hypothetical protein